MNKVISKITFPFKNIHWYLKIWCNTWFGIHFQEKYCKIWDEKLNQLIDQIQIGGDVEYTRYWVTLNGVMVWWSNEYYSFGHIYMANIVSRRPKISTMIRLAKLKNAILDKDKALKEAREREEYLEAINKI